MSLDLLRAALGWAALILAIFCALGILAEAGAALEHRWHARWRYELIVWKVRTRFRVQRWIERRAEARACRRLARDVFTPRAYVVSGPANLGAERTATPGAMPWTPRRASRMFCQARERAASPAACGLGGRAVRRESHRASVSVRSRSHRRPGSLPWSLT